MNPTQVLYTRPDRLVAGPRHLAEFEVTWATRPGSILGTRHAPWTLPGRALAYRVEATLRKRTGLTEPLVVALWLDVRSGEYRAIVEEIGFERVPVGLDPPVRELEVRC